jgi:hypothetical protein
LPSVLRWYLAPARRQGLCAWRGSSVRGPTPLRQRSRDATGRRRRESASVRESSVPPAYIPLRTQHAHYGAGVRALPVPPVAGASEVRLVPAGLAGARLQASPFALTTPDGGASYCLVLLRRRCAEEDIPLRGRKLRRTRRTMAVAKRVRRRTPKAQYLLRRRKLLTCSLCLPVSWMNPATTAAWHSSSAVTA